MNDFLSDSIAVVIIVWLYYGVQQGIGMIYRRLRK